jgi:hypothetical protein
VTGKFAVQSERKCKKKKEKSETSPECEQIKNLMPVWSGEQKNDGKCSVAEKSLL